jgi:hypothetical protein
MKRLRVGEGVKELVDSLDRMFKAFFDVAKV